MNPKHLLSLIYGLIVMLVFVSCQSGIEPTKASLPPIITGSPTLSDSSSEPLTATSLPTATIEVKSEKIPTSPAVVPSNSPTIVSTPTTTLLPPTIVPVTLTPLPTLEGEELESAVAELLANPMNCDVPCWWGAIPGVTSLDEIKHAVSPYNFDIEESPVDEQLTILRLGIGYVEERNDFEIRIGYGFINSLLIDVSAYSPSISEILAKYGQPDEVWLETGITPLPIPIRLNLVYYQEGMAFGYVADGVVENDMFIGCFADEETGELRLVIPNSTKNYRDFAPIFEDDRRYRPLEEATGLTMEDFMQQFSDPSQPQCLETPIELWD